MNMGLKDDAMEVALEGLREFPDGHPNLYRNLGDVYMKRGWIDEAKSVLEEGLRKFSDDEEMKKLLDEIEDHENDPYKGKRPPIVSLLILLVVILNKIKKKL